MGKQMDRRKMVRGLEDTSQVRRWAMILVDSRMDINEYEHSSHSLYARLIPSSWDIGRKRTLVPVFKGPRD